MNHSYPALDQFFGCYFHQDWYSEAGSWESAVDFFLKEADQNAVVNVCEELNRLRSQTSDGQSLDNALFALGCYYEPRCDGLTSNEWIDLLQERLASGV